MSDYTKWYCALLFTGGMNGLSFHFYTVHPNFFSATCLGVLVGSFGSMLLNRPRGGL